MVDTMSRFRIHSYVLAQNKCSQSTALFVRKLKPENIEAVFTFFACALANRIASIPATLAIVLDWSQLNRVGLSPSALNQSAQTSQQNIIQLITLVIIRFSQVPLWLPLAGFCRLQRWRASRDGAPAEMASGLNLFCVAPGWIKPQTTILVWRAISL